MSGHTAPSQTVSAAQGYGPLRPEPRFCLSPVDYEAWSKGYMPPSEHVLIDALAYRGARVACMSDLGDAGAWWVVTRGPRPSVERLNEIWRLLFADDTERLSDGAEAPRPDGDAVPGMTNK